MSGNMGIGCISDMDPQPLIVRSHLGTYAITTVDASTTNRRLQRFALNVESHIFLR